MPRVHLVCEIPVLGSSLSDSAVFCLLFSVEDPVKIMNDEYINKIN